MCIRHILFLSALLFATQANASPGFRQVTSSALNISVWYPTASQEAVESVGENPAFSVSTSSAMRPLYQGYIPC